MIYLELFLTFFKIGMFTFGGGYAMFPLIQEAVIKNAWLSEESLIDFVAISESTPGPFAVNISTYVGSELAGFLGGVCASLGVVLPSFLIILIVAKFFTKFKDNKIVKGCMMGLKPCVIGLIGSAIISMGITVFFPNGIKNMFFNLEMLISLIILLFSLLLVYKKVHPIFVILISAFLGIVGGVFLF